MAFRGSFDVAVIGAGVFGAWTAWHLARKGCRTVLLEAYAPAHSRSSSGGESRILRMAYAGDKIYTRWAKRSLAQWKKFCLRGADPLFLPTGVLWLAGGDQVRLRQSVATLACCSVKHEELTRSALERRYPQVNFRGVTRGLWEPESGVLLARRAVARVVADAIRCGVEYRTDRALPPRGTSFLKSLKTKSGRPISAGWYVFACGPWLGKLFPELLGPRIFPSRQEVFFFGTPGGDTRFCHPSLPTWFFQGDDVYGMPDIDGRGLKLACDVHGPSIDPDSGSRLVSVEGAQRARRFLARRFPALANAPIVETRVCQYENTSNGDFLIDRHPSLENVWVVGGGSGHGFKHGPAVGEYTSALLFGETNPEPRFSLARKRTRQHREVH